MSRKLAAFAVRHARLPSLRGGRSTAALEAPAESTCEWGLYKVLATILGKEAFRPLDQGGCPFAAKSAAQL